MNRTLELPEPVYEALVDAARASGLEPAEWIAARLPMTAGGQVSAEERRAARERLWKHVVSSGRPTGINNEGIDADLARAYGDTHDEEAPRDADR